jgi:hypothetical protein
LRWPAGGRGGAPEDSQGAKKQNAQFNAGHQDQVPIPRVTSRYWGKGQKVGAFKPLYLGYRLKGYRISYSRHVGGTSVEHNERGDK